MSDTIISSTDIFDHETLDETAPAVPWNPEDIRIVVNSFSLGHILQMIEDREIDLAPDFQRGYVWKIRQKSRLIESILLGIPLPMFYFSQDSAVLMQVVDGVQRLTTITEFVNDVFCLEDLEYLTDFDQLSFSQLPAHQKRRFKNTQIYVSTIGPATPLAVKFDIFRRINTGGTPLNGQEIRHCLSSPKVREFLVAAADLQAFKEATGGSLAKAKRMEEREIVLRFFAFYLFEQDYDKVEGLDHFLGLSQKKLDHYGESELHLLLNTFESAMDASHKIFGDDAFRKTIAAHRGPLNRSVFDCWSVNIARLDKSKVLAAGLSIRRGSQALLNNPEFIAAVSQGTDSVKKVRYRFDSVRKVLDECMS